MNELDRHPHHLFVHLVWATRDRERLLDPAIDGWLAQFLAGRASDLGCTVLATGIASDHVHALVAFPAAVTVASIAHRLKSASSRALGPRVAAFAWQPGYYAETLSDVVGLVDELTRHRERHGDAARPEAWEGLLEASV
jgi:putative transposase